MTWGAVAGAAVGVYTANKQSKAAGAASDAQSREAGLAYQRSLPWDTQGLFGSAKFDEEGRQLDMTLSGPWQAEYNKAMTRASDERRNETGYLNEIDRQNALAREQEGGYDIEMAKTAGTQADYARQMGYASDLEGDVYGAGQKFYEQQKALYSPEQEQNRLSLEARLLGQGRLGSTGGAGEMEALRQAQAQTDLQAQYSGLDKAQQQIDTYRGRGVGALNTENVYRGYANQSDARVGMFRGRAAEEQDLLSLSKARGATDLGLAETIGQLPQKYAETGRGIGTDMSTIAGTSAEMAGQAAQARAASEASKYGAYADAFKGMFGN